MGRSDRRPPAASEDIHERRRHAIPDANLLYLLIIEQGVEGHDIDILVAIGTFPQTVAGKNGDPTILNFGEFIR